MACSRAWNYNLLNPGVSASKYYQPAFGYQNSQGVYASSSGASPTYGQMNKPGSGGQGYPVKDIAGDIVLNLYWYYFSTNTWKGTPGFCSNQIWYDVSLLNQQIALDSYVNVYQSWWYTEDESGSNLTEKMRVRPTGNKRVDLLINNQIYSDGSVIYSDDSVSYVYHCDAWDDNSGWHVYITDSTGKLAAMELPFVVSKLGFSCEWGGEDRCWTFGSAFYSDPALVQLDTVAHYGWAVATVFLWKSGDGFVIGDASTGTDLSAVIDAINQNTLTTANGCAQIVDAVNKQGGQIVDAIGGLPDKIASGLTPSQDDIQGGITDVTSKFDASYGNTKSLFDMVENLYVTLKDGFAGASDVTSWDFPGIKVKLNGEVHTICPEMKVQKTDIGLQQYLTLVVRVVLVVALIWMVWNKVHRVIVPKEADE